MKDIDPSELSGLLDGELDPERAQRVRAAIEKGGALKAEFNLVLALDAAWRMAASTAAFRPDVRLQVRPSWRSAARGVCLVTALLALRFAPKFVLGPAVGLIASGIALAALLSFLAWATRPPAPVSRHLQPVQP